MSTFETRTFTLTRAATKAVCPWLTTDIAAGTTVYEFHGHTYGSASPDMVMVTVELNRRPFLALPADMVQPTGAIWTKELNII